MAFPPPITPFGQYYQQQASPQFGNQSLMYPHQVQPNFSNQFPVDPLNHGIQSADPGIFHHVLMLFLNHFFTSCISLLSNCA
jgi:hypothetical protein